MSRRGCVELNFVKQFYRGPVVIPGQEEEKRVICPRTHYDSEQLTKVLGKKNDRKTCGKSGACEHSWPHTEKECELAKEGSRCTSCPYHIKCVGTVVWIG